MPKRPGANKSSRSLVGQRRQRMLDLQKTGATLPEIRTALKSEGFPASTITVWRDLRKMTENFNAVNAETFAEARRVQLTVFELMEKALLEGKATTEVVREWRGIRTEISQLLGLNAPTKSVSARIDATVDPAKLVGYRRFAHETRNLSQEQLESVYEFARSLDSKPALAAINPPASSEMWEEE